MTTEYVAKIKGDTSNLEKMLKEAQGHLERLNDNEVIIKFDYDQNQPELTKIIQKIINEVPDIDIKFKYDINKAALAQEKAKLSQMELSLDTSQITKEIQKVHKQYTEIFENASDEELDKLENKLSSLYQTLIDMPKGLEAFETLPKEIQEQLEDLEEVEPLKMFSDKDIQKQKALVEELERTVSDLSSKIKSDDIGKEMSKQLNNVQDDAKETSDSLNELLIKFSEYSKNKNYNQVSSFWDGLKNSVSEGNEEAIRLLKTLKLIDDESQSINIVNDGNVKSGGIIGEDRVLLATKNRQIGDSSRLEETTKLKEKLEEAANAGINVAKILDIVADSEKKVFLEIQEKATGNILGSYEDNWVNPDIFEATDSQILKLIEDLQKLNELGIGVDVNPTNILYDKNKGFSFIDLDLNPTEYKTQAELLEDALGGITGTLRTFYEDLDNVTGIESTDNLENRIKSIVASVQNANNKLSSDTNSIDKQTEAFREQTSVIEKNTFAKKENEQIDDSSNNISNAAIKQGEYYAKGLASAENLEKAGQAASLLSASALEALSEDDANFHLSGVAQANQYVRGLNEGLADANLNNDNINRQIVGSIDYQDVQNLENLTPLKNQLTEIIELITDKNRLFLEESELVASLVPQEVNNLESLYSTLIFIREEIEALQRAFAGLTFQGDINTEWVTSLSKLKNVDFTQISSSLSTMYQTISKLNLKDSNLLTSVQALLNKGKELENLAKVLSASAKDIKATKDATVSQKDKDTKASYQKELALRKEQLKLEHEINVAQAKGADNAAEIVAKNKPIIALLEKQVETEKERKNTSRQYRNEINAEISAIEKRNKAEVAGVKAATAEKNRKQTQTDLEKQIKELTGLQEKLTSLSEQTKKYTPEYLGDVTSQLSIIDNQIDTLKNAQTDIINAKDVAELNQISQDTKDIVKSTKAIKANASDTAYKIAKEIRVKSLKTEIADYLSKNTKLSREFRSELNLLIQKLNSGELTGDELLKLESRFEDIKTSAKQAGEEGRSFFDQMRQRMTDMNAKFIAQFLSWQDLIRYIRQATQTVTELDSALTELRKVSDASTERINQSFEKSAQTAQELGASITDVINMTADWARLGYNVDQAEDLARVTTLFETVGDNMTADKASSYLISTLQGFQLATDQAETIVDKYNEVANNFAIDTAGIGEALQRSAASFNAANTDLSKSIALVTATNEVLQNPESVGTLWKTLSARIRGATTELKDLGEEEDEFTQTTSKLRDLVKGLTGFDIMKDEKNFKDIYEIILGIGKEWDNLTDVERASLGEALAGKRNSNALYAVLGNLDTLQEAYQKAEDSAGSAAKEQENYAQSVQYSIDRNIASLQELARDFLSSDFLKAVLEVANDLLQTLDKIVEKIGPGGVLAILTSIVALTKTKSIKSTFDGLAGFGDIISKFAGASSTITATGKALETTSEVLLEGGAAGLEMAQGMASAEVAMEGANGAAVGLAGSLGPLLAIAAIIAGGVIAWDAFTTTVQEAESAVESSKQKVTELQSEVDTLNQIENKTSGQQKRLELLRKELDYQTKILETRQQTLTLEKYGNKFSDQFDSDNAYTQYSVDKANRYDVNNEGDFVKYGASIQEDIAKLEEFRKASEDASLSERERQKNYEYANKKQKEIEDEYGKYLNKISDYMSKKDQIQQDIENGYLQQGTEEYERAQEMLKAYSLWIVQDEAILNNIDKALGRYDYVQDDLKVLASKWETGSISSNIISDKLIEHIEGFSEAEKAAFYNSIKDAKSWAEVLDIIDGKQEEVNETTSEYVPPAWDKENALKEYNIDSEKFNEYLAIFTELNPELKNNSELLEQAAVAHYRFDEAVESLRSHLNDYVENLETLDKTSVEYANSIKALAKDLSGLTGLDFSITDAQSFATDINNLELLRQALDGDNDALTQLRENANQAIVARIDTELNVDGFNEQYQELAEWIAANPDIGTLEAQSYLNTSPFVQACLDLLKQGKMTANDLRQIFANLGWNITWDTTKMQVPKIQSGGSKVASIPTSELSKMSASQRAKYTGYNGSFQWDYMDVPTNIRFVSKSSGITTPKATKPTSSSGSNYKPEQKKSGGGGGKSGSSKAKDDEKELEDTYDEFFDYFERRVKVLTDAISLLDAHLENVVGSAAKNKLLDAQERIYKMQQQEYADAKRMYEEMANKALAKIPDNIKNDIINGAVAIDEFIGKGNEEVVQAMQDYTKWADKIAECKQQLAELKEQLRQLELKRFKNIAQDWQDLFDLRQNNAIDLIDKQIDLFEEAGQLIGKSFYEEQKAQAQKQYELLSNERKALVDELNRGLSNGTIEIGSDEWLEMRSILSDLEGQILDCAKAIETFDNAILQLHVDVFERIQGQLDDFDDQLSDMASFLDDADVSNKYGEWSQEGMARAGLLAQQFDLANKKVHDYAEEIEWLNEQYKLGKYSTTEYMDRLADLMSEQRDAAQTADDMKDAMVELNRDRVDIVIDGINEEIKAYEELIDAQKKALQAQKDLHDYEKQVADENKAIVDIERQLAAIRNDDSAAANAKRKQLEAQLKDAQDQLSETEYDHSITAQEDALDAQMEQYRQMREAEIQSWEEYAANIEQVMIDMLAMVQANAFEIGTVITETATAHGFQISQALTDPWFTAQQTIAQYGEVLSAETSSFIASLEGVEQETWNLQAQADATSVQLAQMFGNRADNLVNELQRSWESEQNLANMTHALSDAFVQALDSGYRIGEVVNPLESAKAATDALADAADSAASAFDGMADSARRAAQEAANANSMPTTASRGTPYEPPYKTHVTTLYNAPYSTVKWDRIGGYYRYYAKGLSKADKDQLAWTQELGDEVIVSPTRSSILTPIKKGDAVIDAKGTQNLFELAKVDPKQLLNGMSSASTPTLQQNKAFGVNISSLVTVNGPINDSLAMMKIAANEAQSKITKTLKDLSDEIKY